MYPAFSRIAQLAGVLGAITALPAHAHETETPHVFHDIDVWMAAGTFAVAIVAGALIVRYLRR